MTSVSSHRRREPVQGPPGRTLPGPRNALLHRLPQILRGTVPLPHALLLQWPPPPPLLRTRGGPRGDTERDEGSDRHGDGREGYGPDAEERVRDVIEGIECLCRARSQNILVLVGIIDVTVKLNCV